MSSNLHKDLIDAQLHLPKGFEFAANSTKLTKDASGNLVWAADSGGGGGVTSIIAGTNVTISPSGGTGDVTINSTAVSEDLHEQSFRGCFDYTAPTERGSSNNYWVRQLGCREIRYSDNSHATDTGANTATLTLSPSVIIQAAEIIVKKAETLVCFNGIIDSTASVGAKFALFKANGCIEGTDLRDMTLIHEEDLSLSVGTNCFSSILNLPLVAQDMIIPAILMDGTNAISYIANIALKN